MDKPRATAAMTSASASASIATPLGAAPLAAAGHAARASHSSVPLAPDRERALRPGDVFKECDVCPDMIVVPAGRFTMGGPKHEAGSSNGERPQRTVTFAEPFAVGRFSVTFAEWDACLAAGGCFRYRPHDQGWGRDRQPVIGLGWHDAAAFVRWLARLTGRPYRLLSEAEREYVTRAGTTTAFWWGSDSSTDRANYDGNRTYACGGKGVFRERTLPVDQLSPNPWGLYQVHGNVSDWVEDCWHPNYDGAPMDGSARKGGSCYMRVMRGGAWSRTPNVMRSASRIAFGTDIRMQYFGVRVARTLRRAPPEPKAGN